MEQASTKKKKQRELQLKLLKVAVEIKRAKEDAAVLKSEIINSNDDLRQKYRISELQKELKQCEENIFNLATPCCFGAPDWNGNGDHWESMHEGIEIVHTAKKSSAGSTATGLVAFEYLSRPLKLQIYNKPFAKGGMRMAFYAQDDTGRKLVAKRALEEHRKLKNNVKAAHVDAEAAALSKVAAEDFTAACNKNCNAYGINVTYLSVSVALLPAGEGEYSFVFLHRWRGSPSTFINHYHFQNFHNAGKTIVYSLEPLMDEGGQWKKFTRNDGSILDAGKDDEVMQAFTHFSMLYSMAKDGGKIAIVDTQGVKRGDSYTLTDPSVATPSKAYGCADFGSEAMETFMKEHKCNSLCRALGC